MIGENPGVERLDGDAKRSRKPKPIAVLGGAELLDSFVPPVRVRHANEGVELPVRGVLESLQRELEMAAPLAGKGVAARKVVYVEPGIGCGRRQDAPHE